VSVLFGLLNIKILLIRIMTWRPPSLSKRSLIYLYEPDVFVSAEACETLKKLSIEDIIEDLLVLSGTCD